MKPILPSLKEKKRYLAFEIISDSKFSKSEIEDAVKKQSLEFLGTLGYGKAGVIMLNIAGNEGIIKVNNRFTNHIKASLMLIKDINNKRVIFKTKGVSGVLKKAKSKYLTKKEEGK